MRRLNVYAFLSLLVLVLAVVSTWASWAQWVLPARLFRKAVITPIPASVRHMRGSSSYGPGLHTYILRFNISEPDLQLILASDQFIAIGYIDYSGNDLVVGETRRSTIVVTLFDGWRRRLPPRWFKLADLSAFNAWLVEQERGIDFHKIRVLLYNHGISQAYYIEYEARGA